MEQMMMFLALVLMGWVINILCAIKEILKDIQIGFAGVLAIKMTQAQRTDKSKDN